ncbi:preprotein translocase subunit YajC [Enterococcus faecalis]|uniref:preprotein translocase subunit YajC n=1 Tax=Staphylococcus aureus TaxID=1280 RepID=UPI00372A03B8
MLKQKNLPNIFVSWYSSILNNLQPGDAVVTIGGLHGVISEISSDKKKVTLDCEGALFDFDHQSIRAKK